MDYTTEEKRYLIEKHGLYIDNIPPLLKAEKHWVNWRKEVSGKIPYQAHAGLTGCVGKALIDTPSTWATFDDALCGLLEHNMNGIGYAIGDIKNNPNRIFLADQDHVIESGYATPIAQGIVMELRTYTEYSQSGNGLHSMGQWDEYVDSDHGDILEIYFRSRFVFMTGNLYKPECKLYLNIEAREKEVKHVYATYCLSKKPISPITHHNEPQAAGSVNSLQYSVDGIIALGMQDEKFRGLFTMDADYLANHVKQKSKGGPDWSDVDAALMAKVRFYTGDDFEMTEAVMKRSPLYSNAVPGRPEKWDRKDYLYDQTFKKQQASGVPSEFYNWPAPQKHVQVAGLLKPKFTFEGEEPMIEETIEVIDPQGRFADDTPKTEKEKLKEAKAKKKEEEQAAKKAKKEADEAFKKSRVKKLIGITEGMELWFNKGEFYITLANKTNMKITSVKFKNWLINEYQTAYKNDVPASTDIKSAIEMIVAHASNKEEQVYIRYAQHNNKIYIDMGIDDKFIVVDKTGWACTNEVPVKFVRHDDMAAMPTPDPTGTLDDIRPFFLLSDGDFKLAVGWQLVAMRAQAPFYGICVSGEAGSGKTTVSKILKQAIDPTKSFNIDLLPENPHEFGVHIDNTNVLAYDNVSYIHKWLSDLFCMALTGGVAKKRSLYTNSDQCSIELKNPIIFNGIPDIATAGDLVRRSLMIKPLIADDLKEDAELTQAFTLAYPKILGCLLNMLVAGYNSDLPMHKGSDSNRMVGCSTWVCRCFGDNQWLDIYNAMRQDAIGTLLDASLLYHAITQMLDGDISIFIPSYNNSYIQNLADQRDKFNTKKPKHYWKGRAMDLLEELRKTNVWKEWEIKKIPSSPQTLGTMIRNDIPSLRNSGIHITETKIHGNKHYTITRVTQDSQDKVQAKPMDIQFVN